MMRSGTATFTDPDDYQASVAGACINLVLTAGGDFRARVTWVELPALRLLHFRETVPRINFVKFGPGTVAVAFPTKRKSAQIWGGVKFGPRDMLVLGRGGNVYQRANGASQWGLIILATEELSTHARALTGTDLVLPATTRILKPPPAASARLLRLHASACRLAEVKPEIMVNRQIVRALEHDMFHVLIHCLTTNDAHSRTAARPRHASVMDRFEAVLSTQRDRQISTTELCAGVGVSERTLRTCCAAVLGMSPGSYVRLRRLGRVRIALTRADPATASIAEIARRHGFSELGRFAAAYRVAFGETPSITLRTARARMFDRATAEFA
jgi:AraC-like DNA-binding protein